MKLTKNVRTVLICLLMLSMSFMTAFAGTTRTVSKTDAKGNIKFAYWGSTTEAAAIKAVVDNFQKNNPNITVESEWIQSGYLTKLQTMIAGGTAPDVMLISGGDLPGYADSFSEMKVNAASFTSSALVKAMTYGGKVYAKPFIIKPKVMAINVDLFKKNNIPLPSKTIPMTVEQFEKISKKITTGTGTKKIYGSEPLWLGNWIYAFGGSYYKNNGQESNLGSVNSIKAADYIIRTKQLGYMPSNAEKQGQDMFNWFLSGRIGMYSDFGPWYLPQMVGVKGFNWDLVPFPGNGGNKEVDGLAIGKDSQNPEAAQAFINYLCENKNAQTIIGGNKIAYGVPVIASALPSFETIYPGKNLKAFVISSQKQICQETQKKTNEIGNVLNDIDNRTGVGIGKEKPSTVFPELDIKINKILQSND